MEIRTYPDPVLKTYAEAVKNVDGELQRLIDGMIEVMYSAPGIGLAANQVGELKRVIVFDLEPREIGRRPVVLINPEIVLGGEEIVWEEACLSVVDFSAEVVRRTEAMVRGLDRHGNPVSIEAKNLLAICLQHEIDHLNGILFIDHISSLKRALYKKRLKKTLRGG
jgi:peptide deformylase